MRCISGFPVAGVSGKQLMTLAACLVSAAIVAAFSAAGASAAAPKIATTYAGPVGSDYATITAKINPGKETTTYRLEAGTAPCETGGCATAATGTLAAVGTPETVVSRLTALAPATTYYFRVTAENGEGTLSSKERTFRTFATAGSSPLLDGRAYELVTANSALSADFGNLTGSGGFGMKTKGVAPAGDVSTFTSLGSLDPAIAAPASVQYLARRTPTGWTTENVTVPSEPLGGLIYYAPIFAFSPDLTFFPILSEGKAGEVLAPGAVPGVANLYLRDNDSGAIVPITNTQPTGVEPEESFCASYAGASADESRVFFYANAALTDDAPPVEVFGSNLYEWTAAEGIKLVSIRVENGKESPSAGQNGFAGPTGNGCDSGESGSLVRRAISTDGSHVVWTAHNSEAEPILYDRVDAQRTIELDANQGGTGSGGGEFLDASEDGNRVAFKTGNIGATGEPYLLTPDAGASALYLYDVPSETLTSLTQGLNSPGYGGVDDIVGSSEDLKTMYVLSESILSDGPNANGETAHEGELNIFMWREGQPFHFIATVDTNDVALSQDSDAYVSPDGGVLAFPSSRKLTGYDNTVKGSKECNGYFEHPSRCSEVYVYYAASDQLICASCNPSGASPVLSGPLGEEGRLNELTTGDRELTHRARPLSSDGRLFFESQESLVPRDTNSQIDVYEFERLGTGTCVESSEGFSAEAGGCVALVSGGGSDTGSYFVGASETGEEVQISTRQQLLGADQDENYDVYSVREGGGFPESPGTEPCLSEGACRSAAPPPSPVQVGSNVPNGTGDLPVRRYERRCGHRRRRQNARAGSRATASKRGGPVCQARHKPTNAKNLNARGGK